MNNLFLNLFLPSLFFLLNDITSLAFSYEKDSSLLSSSFKSKKIKSNLFLAQNESDIKIFTVTGKGKSKEEAADNAVFNALLNAVPTYISKREFERIRETAIDGKVIEKESLDIWRESKFSFKKGSIMSFKVDSFSKKNDIVFVIATVKVRSNYGKRDYHPSFAPPIREDKKFDNQTVYKVGKGLSEKQAEMNAMEQALFHVIGPRIQEKTFESVNYQELMKMINDEVVQSESYDLEKFDQYSTIYTEGYIESFNKKNSFKEDGWFWVLAEIKVRQKPFKFYVDEIFNDSSIDINIKE
tara:strand:- start:3647 stop:4540 length:894 start_codon:yes stop_codon:yes gene_type:complete